MRLLLWLMPLLFQAVAAMGPSVAGRQPVLATNGTSVGLALGRDDGVYFARSTDAGRTFSAPVRVAQSAHLSLGMRRGPRIAMVGSTIVITAIVGERGNGADGDLMAWRSDDDGRTWTAGTRINDVPGAAREGLQDLAAGPRGPLVAAWLDLRATGTRIYTSMSSDGGRTWGANRLAYASPTGSVCQCCHPSVAISAAGDVAVMFRNEIKPSAASPETPPTRDMYVTRAPRNGAFEPAVKLGVGSWPLAACPMDGGDVTFDDDGQLLTIWRREDGIFLDKPGQPEERIATGTNPVLAMSGHESLRAWTAGDRLIVEDAHHTQVATLTGAHWPVLLTLANGSVLLAYEHDGESFVRPVRLK